jgi:hypothetical protein
MSYETPAKKLNRREKLAGVDAATSFGSMEAAVKPTGMCLNNILV